MIKGKIIESANGIEGVCYLCEDIVPVIKGTCVNDHPKERINKGKPWTRTTKHMLRPLRVGYYCRACEFAVEVWQVNSTSNPRCLRKLDVSSPFTVLNS